ncbi:unnamed protein product [Owenia fusiformis]|uniref:Uncharacterized protein n=1 Tax=Owenia fusiformis TaxID=6347 RepID=A0A8S4Q249_OWEFU|nr:unnamed protein product [Owenia fusiformis]
MSFVPEGHDHEGPIIYTKCKKLCGKYKVGKCSLTCEIKKGCHADEAIWDNCWKGYYNKKAAVIPCMKKCQICHTPVQPTPPPPTPPSPPHQPYYKCQTICKKYYLSKCSSICIIKPGCHAVDTIWDSCLGGYDNEKEAVVPCMEECQICDDPPLPLGPPKPDCREAHCSPCPYEWRLVNNKSCTLV